jgi:hydroxybutyrate-dimer hydrolase
MPHGHGLRHHFGGVPVTGFGKTLADYVTYGNLYQPARAGAGATMAESQLLQLHDHHGMNARAQAAAPAWPPRGW